MTGAVQVQAPSTRLPCNSTPDQVDATDQAKIPRKSARGEGNREEIRFVPPGTTGGEVEEGSGSGGSL